jgi:hypothetical protein
MAIFPKGFLQNALLTFTLPLILGMQNQQVLALQKILNQNPQTQIAQTGPGSPGNETTYFGTLTQAAVNRFQNLYASDILIPAGLSSPTGVVGPLTLEKLNSIPNPSISSDPLAAYRSSAASIPDMYLTDQKIQSIQTDVDSIVNTALTSHQTPQIDPAKYQNALNGEVIITAISAHSGLPGAIISIQAQNLDSTNTVYFCSPSVVLGSVCSSSFLIQNLTAPASALSFALPPFPPGRYDLAIQNSHGFSNTSFFIVLSNSSKTVSVGSIMPSSVHWGGMITITGSGFAPTGNEVVTAFDTIKNVPSPDGKTLSVQIAPDQLKEEAALGTGTIAIPDSIAVITNNGYTTGTGFNVNI